MRTISRLFPTQYAREILLGNHRARSRRTLSRGLRIVRVAQRSGQSCLTQSRIWLFAKRLDFTAATRLSIDTFRLSTL